MRSVVSACSCYSAPCFVQPQPDHHLSCTVQPHEGQAACTHSFGGNNENSLVFEAPRTEPHPLGTHSSQPERPPPFTSHVHASEQNSGGGQPNTPARQWYPQAEECACWRGGRGGLDEAGVVGCSVGWWWQTRAVGASGSNCKGWNAYCESAPVVRAQLPGDTGHHTSQRAQGSFRGQWSVMLDGQHALIVCLSSISQGG